MAPELLAEPEALVRALGRGLRRFHDSLPVADCPFDMRLDTALALVRKRAATGLILPEDLQFEFEGIGLDEALRRLEADRPTSEDLVVCHGDYCFPNAMLEDGEVTGYLDLAELGVADRWYDLAVATWSTNWNVGPGYEDAMLEAYGIERDDERDAYYRLLYCLTS